MSYTTQLRNPIQDSQYDFESTTSFNYLTFVHDLLVYLLELRRKLVYCLCVAMVTHFLTPSFLSCGNCDTIHSGFHGVTSVSLHCFVPVCSFHQEFMVYRI